MLLGIWKNVEDLEASLCLQELELVVKTAREREDRQNKWLALVNGINLEESNSVDKVKEMKERIEARQQAEAMGVSEEQFDLQDFGIDVETE